MPRECLVPLTEVARVRVDRTADVPVTADEPPPAPLPQVFNP